MSIQRDVPERMAARRGYAQGMRDSIVDRIPA